MRRNLVSVSGSLFGLLRCSDHNSSGDALPETNAGSITMVSSSTRLAQASIVAAQRVALQRRAAESERAVGTKSISKMHTISGRKARPLQAPVGRQLRYRRSCETLVLLVCRGWSFRHTPSSKTLLAVGFNRYSTRLRLLVFFQSPDRPRYRLARR